MRIATWNVERLKHIKDLDQIRVVCEQQQADILVLTETDARLHLDYKHCFSSKPLKGITDPAIYADTENRVSIFTNYECVQQCPTCDDYTAVCVEIQTERGKLLVYGTIIGTSGNRNTSYLPDLKKQLHDIKQLTEAGYHLCLIGDYNCSFNDSYYFTAEGREQMLRCFRDNHISLLTGEVPECVDHIAISTGFLKGSRAISIKEWNTDKRLSDHKGILVNI